MKNIKLRTIVILSSIVVGLFVAAIAVSLTTRPAKAPQTAGVPPQVKSLEIKEWGAALPLASSISDAYYTYSASNDEVFISTKRLDTALSRLHGCTSGLHGLYYKRTTSAPLTLTEQRHPESLCAAPVSAETEQISSLQVSIRAAAHTAVTAPAH